MSVGVVGLVLLAAVLHASWNAVLRGGSDRLWLVTVMSFASTAAGVPVVLALPLPARESWPYLGFSAAVQVLYAVFLVLSYRVADLGAVYPVIRGVVPLLVTLGAAVFAGEGLHPATAGGIVLVSLGIMAMALGKDSGGPKALGPAAATGAIIATYTVTDGVGVRLSGNAYAYSAWIFVLYGLMLPLVHLAVRRRIELRGRGREIRVAGLAGVVQLATYAIVMWAFTLSPLGPVSALRETSVVVAALIGWRFLGERLSAARLGACAAIALGAFCLGHYV